MLEFFIFYVMVLLSATANSALWGPKYEPDWYGMAHDKRLNKFSKMVISCIVTPFYYTSFMGSYIRKLFSKLKRLIIFIFLVR